jgi:hypothetical protein
MIALPLKTLTSLMENYNTLAKMILKTLLRMEHLTSEVKALLIN